MNSGMLGTTIKPVDVPEYCLGDVIHGHIKVAGCETKHRSSLDDKSSRGDGLVDQTRHA